MRFLKDLVRFAVFFAAVITTLLAVHEFGHLLMALMLGIKVNAYSIGMPPTLFAFEALGLEWRLGALPLGAYVMPDAESLHAASIFSQVLVLVAGPAFNLMTCAGIMLWVRMFAPPHVQHNFDVKKSALRTHGSIFGMAEELALTTRIYGLGGFLDQMAKFSFFIAIGNLMPIPPLDGGRIVFTLLSPWVHEDSWWYIFPFVAGILLIVCVLFRSLIRDLIRMVRRA